MVLWTDASFYETDPPIAAIAVVEEGRGGVIHVAKLVQEESSSGAERAAVVAAFRIARRELGHVVIRCDCEHAAKLTPPKGIRLQHRDRHGNLAHAVARRTARDHLRSLPRPMRALRHGGDPITNG